jgi:RNA polymerase sigma-70 factor (ECF subfamily)
MPIPNKLESDLLERFARGDQTAFEAIFHQYQAEVYRWVARIVRDRSTAEDIVVEAFWRAYRGRGRFDPSRGFAGWMRQIATNLARDYLRAARRRIDRQSRDDESGCENAAPRGCDAKLKETVEFAFRKLPPKLQLVATLALIEERSYEEIAEALDLPVGTIKSRVFRARLALRKELARRGINQ